METEYLEIDQSVAFMMGSGQCGTQLFLLIQGLYERFSAKFVLLVYRPEQVVETMPKLLSLSQKLQPLLQSWTTRIGRMS